MIIIKFKSTNNHKIAKDKKIEVYNQDKKKKNKLQKNNINCKDHHKTDDSISQNISYKVLNLGIFLFFKKHIVI